MRASCCKTLQIETQFLYAIEIIKERGYAHCGVYAHIPKSKTTCCSQWFRTQNLVSKSEEQQFRSKTCLQAKCDWHVYYLQNFISASCSPKAYWRYTLFPFVCYSETYKIYKRNTSFCATKIPRNSFNFQMSTWAGQTVHLHHQSATQQCPS